MKRKIKQIQLVPLQHCVYTVSFNDNDDNDDDNDNDDADFDVDADDIHGDEDDVTPTLN